MQPPLDKQTPSPDLFGRWLIVVYLPLFLVGLSIVLLPFGVLPRWWKWFFLLLVAYSIPAVRLLMAGLRSGRGIPAPHAFIAAARSSGTSLAAMLGSLAEKGGQLKSDGIPRPRIPRRGSNNPQGLGAQLASSRQASPAYKAPAAPFSQRIRGGAIIIAVVLAVGGILLYIGIGDATSARGVFLLGLGGLLVISSITIPTFKIVDSLFKSVRRGPGRNSDQRQTRSGRPPRPARPTRRPPSRSGKHSKPGR